MRSLRVLVALLALSLSAPALAAEPTADEKNAARQMLVDGYVALEKGDAKHALEVFRKADGIMHVPTTKLAIARAQARLGQIAEAEETLHALLKTPERADDPPPYVKARSDAKLFLEEIGPRLAQITLKGVPDDATVKIDGTTIARADLASPRRVNPGKHVVEVAQASGAPHTETLDLKEGEKHTVSFDARAPDNKDKGGAPRPPPDEGGGTNYLMIGGFALAGVGVVAGTITGVLAIGRKSDAEDQYCRDGKCPPEANNDLDAADRYATISTVSFIVGAVGLGVGIFGLVTGSSSAPKAGANGLRFTF